MRELVAIAGPNGAGKSTFYEAFLAEKGLLFVNADVLAREFRLDAYEAARLAGSIRDGLVSLGTSFVFETVFSDPHGEKVRFLAEAARRGYKVTLCFIGVSSPELSLSRVAMRVTQGGHDVPDDKLETRFPRVLKNLGQAVRDLPEVRVYDNSDLRFPYRHVATFLDGQPAFTVPDLPGWLKHALQDKSES